MINKVIGIVRESGISGLGDRAVAFVYRRGIRPWLPVTGHPRYSGVPVACDQRWGDHSVPPHWRPAAAADVPEYEATLVSVLKEQTRRGDRVVVVGGGFGVTATVAALQVGAQGRVICFEGASECVEKVRRTAAINGVVDRLTVHHAVVARSISVYGTEPDHAVLSPTELPECDVLELDCEGAEVDILRTITIRPRVVLVETHGLYDASSTLVASLLEELGYRVSGRGLAEPRFRAFCEEHDIRIVVGVRNEEGFRA